MTTTMTKTVAYFGASTGVGLASLKHSLAAGYRCIALLRTPSKLATIFPADKTPNLKIIHGNAHDISAVSQCLQTEDGKLVDEIVSTLGNPFSVSGMLKGDPIDPEVCRKAMTVLLEALAQLRRNGVTGKPHITVFGTTGISRFGRDIPLVYVPLYHVMLKTPHEDKRAMEDSLIASGEDYTCIRGSLMVKDPETTSKIRVGIEDPKKGLESKALGYTISRGDAGRWITENLLTKMDERYFNKIVSITY